MHKNKLGWLSTIGGALASILGILGAACVVCAPVCGVLCISGLLAVIAGAGIAGFLYKYHWIFIIVGGAIFILGIFIILKSRKCYEREGK